MASILLHFVTAQNCTCDLQVHILNLHEQFGGAEGIARDRNELEPKLTHSQFVNMSKPQQ